MNIKTINQLPFTNDLPDKVSICSDEQGITYRWSLNDLNFTLIKGEGENAIKMPNATEENIASGESSIALGQGTNASGFASLAEGHLTIASGDNSHVEGYNTKAIGNYSHAEGHTTSSSGAGSHAEGANTIANGGSSHAEGYGTYTTAAASHAEGYYTNAKADYAHAEGQETNALHVAAHAEGFKTIARKYGHAEGNATEANGESSHAEGVSTKAEGIISHAEGRSTLAQGTTSHAEGRETQSHGESSHAEGHGTKTFNKGSHSEGCNTIAGIPTDGSTPKANSLSDGMASHAEGNGTWAKGIASHAEGVATRANNEAEHAEGKYNVSNANTIHSVGVGTKEKDRKNAHEITTDGKHYILGVGGYNGSNAASASDIATYLPNLVEVTYSELVTLRDESKLVPGQYYHITDYITTTTQADTQSANHPFDIIVLALNENTLSEETYAIQSTRDTDGYFSNNNLSAWKLRYCLDNDTDRFAWADATNGKGVIYRMIDEFGNDCPYDFKNIQFKRYKTTSNDEVLNKDKASIEDYLGIKNNGIFNVALPPVLTIPSDSDYIWCYTFNSLNNTTDKSLDSNTRLNKILEFKNSEVNSKYTLNNIVFRTDHNLTNQSFAKDCFTMTFVIKVDDSWDNYFGQFCRGNVLVTSYIYQNNFGGNFHSNCIVASEIGQNDITNYMQRNVIKSESFYSNHIGTRFTDNRLYNFIVCNEIGELFTNNTIYGPLKHNCMATNITGNTIHDSFQQNTIDHGMYGNVIHGDFVLNTIGLNMGLNTINSKIQSCCIGSGFKQNTICEHANGGIRQTNIGVSCTGNVFTNLLNCNIDQLCMNNNISNMTACKIGTVFRNNYFKQSDDLSSADRPYIQGCTFGDYVWYNNFYNTETASSATAIKCLVVQSYLQGKSATDVNHIEVPVGSDSEIKVVKDQNGEIIVGYPTLTPPTLTPPTKIVNNIQAFSDGLEGYVISDYPVKTNVCVFLGGVIYASIPIGETTGHFSEPIDDDMDITPTVIRLYNGSNIIAEGTVECEDDTYIYRIKNNSPTINWPVELVQGDNGQKGIDLYNFFKRKYPYGGNGTIEEAVGLGLDSYVTHYHTDINKLVKAMSFSSYSNILEFTNHIAVDGTSSSIIMWSINENGNVGITYD